MRCGPIGTMLNSSEKPETPPWRTMFGASKRTTFVVFVFVLPMWPTPMSSTKVRSPMEPTFWRLQPRLSIGGIEPSWSQYRWGVSRLFSTMYFQSQP